MPHQNLYRSLSLPLAVLALAMPAQGIEGDGAIGAAPAALLALDGDVEWGAFLAAECTTCHQRDGAADGIPAVTGWSEDAFRAVMHAYRAGQRANPSMQTVAGRLDDAEIAALSAYFATLPPAQD